MRLGGRAFALEVTMTGRFFTASELESAGAVTKLVEDGEHLVGAEKLAQEILANPQAAIRDTVRYRRTLVAETLETWKGLAGTFDWVHDSDSSQRIAAKLANVKHN